MLLPSIPSGRAREVPVLRMLAEPVAAVRQRAERLAGLVGGEVEETVARVGGGALPLEELPSFACAIEETLFDALRTGEPPVVGIVRDGRLLLDVRALADARSTRSPPRSPAGARVALVALTVGTAGHIDHGKTWLVRALTGKDTDRLPEEQRRGISIDLGYAPLELPDGRRLSLIDVPGHERFVRTMVAGATGIDLFLLVIDAAEGARPQTLEHIAILRLLGVEAGVVAITKADLVDEETLEIAIAEARELVPEAEVVAVSAKTGMGLDDLRAALARVADRSTCATRPGRRASTSTGCSRSGASAPSSPARSGRGRSPRVTCSRLPRAAARCGFARCRCTTLPSSGRPPASGLRSVLPGVDRRDAAPRRCARDARRISGLLPPRRRARGARADRRRRARLGAPRHLAHSGPRRPGRRAQTAQLRLEAPVVAARGDRVVLRGETTLGGATVLDPAPPRRLDEERLELLERGDPASIVSATVHAPVSVESLRARGLLAPAELEEGLAAVVQAGGWAFSQMWLEETRESVVERLRARAEAEPLEPGLAVAELLPPEPWAPAVLPLLPIERRGGMAYLPGVAASLGARAAAAEELDRELDGAGLAAVKVDDPELARYLEGGRPARAARRRLRRLGGRLRACARARGRRVHGRG